MDEPIPKHWLRLTATPEEFERRRLERMAAGFNIPLEKIVNRFGDRPFGRMHPQWRRFVGQMEEGDELWFFMNSEEALISKAGCAGYAIVRGGEIIAVLETLRT